ncbi:hypothetical protein B0H19DRAFT_1083329 [Mycena capillaripes]|nr:hypothetical protein B0H19DRAFT_1083329 [Mycena capillaripes]
MYVGSVPHNDLLSLVPEKAEGTHAFRGTAASSRKEKSPSPDWDEEQLVKDFAAANKDRTATGMDARVLKRMKANRENGDYRPAQQEDYYPVGKSTNRKREVEPIEDQNPGKHDRDIVAIR